MPRKPPPPKSDGWFTHKTICDICKRPRGTGKHAKCSRIRQAAFEEQNNAGGKNEA